MTTVREETMLVGSTCNVVTWSFHNVAVVQVAFVKASFETLFTSLHTFKGWVTTHQAPFKLWG
jgi:hypothetical protein